MIKFVNLYFQVQSFKSTVQQSGPRYSGTLEGLTTIVRNQGWGQLFAGLSINYFKVIHSILNAILQVNYLKQFKTLMISLERIIQNVLNPFVCVSYT